MKALFIDIEASSLSALSYPIEIAWVSEDGTADNHFIFPMPCWFDWSADSEEMHGVQRATLTAYGLPAATVARRMEEAAEGCIVYSDAPVADFRWLTKLLGTAGLMPIPVQNSYDANVQACRPLYARMPKMVATSVALSLMGQSEREAHGKIRVHHRAKFDALRLWYAWHRLGELVAEALEGWPG